MYEFLDRRYALALYEIAREENKVDEVLQELRDIRTLLRENKEISVIIDNPEISKDEKKRFLKEILDGRVSQMVVSFICILIEKGRMANFTEKLEQYYAIYLEEHNTVKVLVKSAIELTDEERERLHKKLELKYKKNVILTCKIDKLLIGGLFVKVGNEVIDGTIANRYNEIKSLMINSR